MSEAKKNKSDSVKEKEKEDKEKEEKRKCKCKSEQDHVQVATKAEQDEESLDPDAATEREWNAHTKEYQQAYSDYLDEISGNNCQVGETLLLKWITTNHDLLCCVLRHRNPHFIYN